MKIVNNPVAKNHKAVESDNSLIVDYGFISNAIKLTLKLTSISKKKAVHGIVFLGQAKYFLFQTSMTYFTWAFCWRIFSIILLLFV